MDEQMKGEREAFDEWRGLRSGWRRPFYHGEWEAWKARAAMSASPAPSGEVRSVEFHPNIMDGGSASQPRVFYLEDFGIVADGVTDNTAALQRAVDVASGEVEAVEVVAWRRYEAMDNEFAAWEFHTKEVDGGEPLMTVAQHQRIVAALHREVEMLRRKVD